MRRTFERIEDARIDGVPGQRYGAFRCVRKGKVIRIIASAGGGWDHVSVSCSDRCPTWEEIDYVKRLFFYPEEAVMQLHVPDREHINCHPFCLHLWRPQTAEEIAAERAEWGESWPYGDLQPAGGIPLPPGEFVGPNADVEVESAR